MKQEADPLHHKTQVWSLALEVLGPKLTDLQVAEELFGRRIDNNLEHLVAIITFADAPGTYLFYSTSQNIRSLKLTDENDAYEKARYYEDLQRKYPDAVKLEQHLLAIDSRADFVTRVKPAIEASQSFYESGRHNTQYLLGVLDQLMQVVPLSEPICT